MAPGAAAYLVVSGGPLGAVYVRQLLRAHAAGRIHARAIVVLDRDPACAAREYASDPLVSFDTADWADALDRHLAAAQEADHLVPYHWAPHLLLGWLQREVAHAGGVCVAEGTLPPRGLPFEGDTSTGDRALSYAAWICPATCIEPPLCPHTRGDRDWSLGQTLATPPPGCDAAAVFPCLHHAFGVGTIPVARLRTERDRVLAGLGAGRRTWLVATASHCHGLAARVVVEPR